MVQNKVLGVKTVKMGVRGKTLGMFGIVVEGKCLVLLFVLILSESALLHSVFCPFFVYK